MSRVQASAKRLFVCKTKICQHLVLKVMVSIELKMLKHYFFSFFLSDKNTHYLETPLTLYFYRPKTYDLKDNILTKVKVMSQ